MTDVSFVKLPSDECNWILLMISQHWFRSWLGVVRQQAITWANVDSDLCRHMASLGPSELIFLVWSLVYRSSNMMSQAFQPMAVQLSNESCTAIGWNLAAVSWPFLHFFVVHDIAGSPILTWNWAIQRWEWSFEIMKVYSWPQTWPSRVSLNQRSRWKYAFLLLKHVWFMPL